MLPNLMKKIQESQAPSNGPEKDPSLEEIREVKQNELVEDRDKSEIREKRQSKNFKICC